MPGLAHRNPTSQVLVGSIIGLGHNVGLRVVAEGVEDATTLTLLPELGCHLIQGSGPVPDRLDRYVQYTQLAPNTGRPAKRKKSLSYRVCQSGEPWAVPSARSELVRIQTAHARAASPDGPAVRRAGTSPT